MMKKIQKNILVAFISLISIKTIAQSVTMYSGMWHPESVISDGKFFYVTDIGKELNPTAKDSDGVLSKFSLEGNLIEQKFSKTILNSPKGTGIINNTIYIADIDRIVSIDLTTGNLVSSIDFSQLGVHLLNDIAEKNDTTLFVTSTDLNKIFQITLGYHQHIETLNIPEIKGANGICFDNKKNRLYANGLGSFNSEKGEGEIGYVDWENGKPKYSKITALTGFFDGIALIDDSTIVVSDWVNLAKAEGVLKKININTGASALIKSEPIGGPADFYFDSKNKDLIIPATQEGKLLKLIISTKK